MKDHPITYFLGANSAQGFASLYAQWIDQSRTQAFYAIKGGAGCGKSTLMAGIARSLEAQGYAVEYIRCSGDPDSLDGISIPGKGAAMVDGTAPHRIDPAYPGATGHYVDLGAGYDRRALFPLREKIVAAARAYQVCYPQAYRRFQAAAESLRRGRAPLHTEGAAEKTKKRAGALLQREAGGDRPGRGRVSRRFLGGLTCKGSLLLEDTVSALCDHGYQIRDDCGLADLLLRELEAGFLDRGCDVVACLDPMRPERLAHLLVPERKAAFLTGPVSGLDCRTIRTESLVDKETWREGRGFLRLSLRVAEELVEEGIGFLAQAKARHDELEDLYHPHVDFSLCQDLTDRLTREILALPDVPD